jgi:hypothetical protein
MKTNRRSFCFFTLVACLTAFCGFAQTTPATNNADAWQNTATNATTKAMLNERLYGKWIFDRDFSFLQLTNTPPATWPKAPPGVPDWTAPNPLLVFGQLNGVSYVIDSNKIIIVANGTVKTNFYEITGIKYPSPNEIVIKMGDGSTNDLHLLDGRMQLDANLGFKLYFSKEVK